MRRLSTKVLALGAVLLLCLSFVQGVACADEKVLLMATTTSTDDTGLLDYLAPLFKEDTGITLQWTATGTGKALKLGENCDVDVLLVHDPDSEKKFVEAGYGVDRTQVMYNDFIIIGPADDPAGIKGLTSTEAFKKIAEKKAIFVSRADESGTHMKEKFVWQQAGLDVPDKEEWYVQTGQGMLITINVAAEKKGYTLTDRGTYIKYEANYEGKPPLVILSEGDPYLLNQYSVIAVNPERCPKAKYDLAKKFIEWMASPRAQQAIEDFRLMGKQLFFPNADVASQSK
ncbi:MAG TPA: substrate-binding domain-containing protein [Acetomicrobium sp.]|uniref:substrate-binding domain-containing protein n=1 Tax=Acetomicrobium mobile TaxID=97477 RepID=UPI0026F0D532|nr:substrate-binding domain-containing protein [Acetomicrobium mobile]HOB10238.1 substrate-binding domain-containing protein [Acetomicrobium sp.]HQA36033.1 substrate-binding domain-containing protein [Acetomicrobium sp.]